MRRVATSGVLPGFGLSFGVAAAYFGLLMLLSLAGLVARSATVPVAKALALFSDPRTLSAFRVILLTSAAAALVSILVGGIVVLHRGRILGSAPSALVQAPSAPGLITASAVEA